MFRKEPDLEMRTGAAVGLGSEAVRKKHWSDVDDMPGLSETVSGSMIGLPNWPPSTSNW